ncbi:sulfite exporter TauE/SafE family protein [Novosphingobium taihuense]|uniref:Probable membrane transporter protein n=1 Tax=Novosphingobium taihuense TaxID=260085 RepID=A0A7W7ETC3_9SPHN|nr:sulfite exporter TauE/SafE family protein [Novosphingobium taihuense]MBB4612859.1 hypothetical protein [Novosphingobium taihuense]
MALLVVAGAIAGAVNAIAGGGPILTLAGMMALGIDPRLANLTSTVALSPGQAAAGFMAWKTLRVRSSVAHHLGGSFVLSIVLAIAGGAVGALLLLSTDPAGFRKLVVWLVLLATAIYAWAGRGKATAGAGSVLSPWLYWPILAILAVYGGYFGGGNSFLVLALLAFSGLAGVEGGAAKNIIVAALNAGAVVIFVASGSTQWLLALPLAVGGLIGSVGGAHLLGRLRASQIRPIVIGSGLFLAAWLAIR